MFCFPKCSSGLTTKRVRPLAAIANVKTYPVSHQTAKKVWSKWKRIHKAFHFQTSRLLFSAKQRRDVENICKSSVTHFPLRADFPSLSLGARRSAVKSSLLLQTLVPWMNSSGFLPQAAPSGHSTCLTTFEGRTRLVTIVKTISRPI